MSNYTAESVQAVKDAVSVVAEGKDITKQSEVDAMAKAIEDAIDALKEKPVIPVNPGKEEKPNSEKTNPDTIVTPEKTVESSKSGATSKSPKTGDNSYVMMWSLLSAVSLGGVATALILSKKKKSTR